MNEINETTETIDEAAPVAEAAPPKPKKERKKGVGTYPFRTKKSILAQIATDDAFASQCLCVVYYRQTAHEQVEKTTKDRNAQGFMSSHAVRGSELAVKILADEELTDEDVGKVRELAGRYGKQLAAHFRAEQIQAEPGLAKVAEIFSAN